MRKHGTHTLVLRSKYLFTASALTVDGAGTVFLTPEEAVVDDTIDFLHDNVSFRMLLESAIIPGS